MLFLLGLANCNAVGCVMVLHIVVYPSPKVTHTQQNIVIISLYLRLSSENPFNGHIFLKSTNRITIEFNTRMKQHANI